MLENPIILLGGSAVFVVLGFVAGLFVSSGQIRTLKDERDRLRAFVENAGIDFKGLRQIGQDLTRNAAAITSAAARMVQLADTAEGTTTDAKAEAIEALEAAFSTCAGRRNGNPCYHQLYRCSNCSKTGCETYGNTHCTNEGFHDGRCVSCGRNSKSTV